jgi:hypothetical protein
MFLLTNYCGLKIIRIFQGASSVKWHNGSDSPMYGYVDDAFWIYNVKFKIPKPGLSRAFYLAFVSNHTCCMRLGREDK